MTGTQDTSTSRSAPDRADRLLLACAALAFGFAGAVILWNTVLFSVVCLENAGDTSPYCDTRWSVPAGLVIFIPLVVLCAVSALATVRGARRGRRLTRRERRVVFALLVILTLVGLVQPFGFFLVPLAWATIGLFVLLVRGVAAAGRGGLRRRSRPAGS